MLIIFFKKIGVPRWRRSRIIEDFCNLHTSTSVIFTRFEGCSRGTLFSEFMAQLCSVHKMVNVDTPRKANRASVWNCGQTPKIGGTSWNKLVEWKGVLAKITHINLTNEKDLFIWSLGNNGQFTVHSMYLHIINQNTPFSHKLIWKLKIPPKVKIFLWYLEQGNFNKGQPN